MKPLSEVSRALVSRSGPCAAAPLSAALATALILTLAPGAGAHSSLVGGFRPVAAEESARAVWVNPAAIGLTGQATAAAELFADETEAFLPVGEDGEWRWPGHLAGANLASATDKVAYGFQWEKEDRPGVPPWTFAIGNRVEFGKRMHAGITAEWRGGDDGGLDGSAALLLPVGNAMRLAAVVDNLRERSVDGVDGRRRWQLGAMLRSPSGPGRVTWDAVREGGEDTDHWFGFALDRSRYAHLSFARSLDGDWTATFSLAAPNHLLGVGASRRTSGERPYRGILSGEWSRNVYPGNVSR